MLSVLMKILSHASAKKKTKKAYGFQISPFYWSFSSGIMAVKRLSRRVMYDVNPIEVATGDTDRDSHGCFITALGGS